MGSVGSAVITCLSSAANRRLCTDMPWAVSRRLLAASSPCGPHTRGLPLAEAVCTVTASTAFTVWHTVLHAEDLHTAPSRSVLPESQAPRPGHPRLRAAEKCLRPGAWAAAGPGAPHPLLLLRARLPPSACCSWNPTRQHSRRQIKGGRLGHLAWHCHITNLCT